MKPSTALDLQRTAVREIVARFRISNPRVFGSVLL
ncbi:nucleotidyltransferase, partial [Klebsiella pneumoniae]|nr:nucleotidyltransferase [Klebsiella pneumoniae]